jgi:hypothetical protein
MPCQPPHRFAVRGLAGIVKPPWGAGPAGPHERGVCGRVVLCRACTVKALPLSHVAVPNVSLDKNHSCLCVIASFSANVRTLSLSLDLRLLTAMQAWRVVGAMFLVLMSFGLLPGTFAWPAGIGDLIVGAYAPFVVLAISRRTPGWHTHVVLLNVLGLLDFVGAIGGGVLSGRSPIGILRGDVTTDMMQELPLSMIPTFAVPFWIVLHIISLIKLRNPQAAAEESAA